MRLLFHENESAMMRKNNTKSAVSIALSAGNRLSNYSSSYKSKILKYFFKILYKKNYSCVWTAEH